MPQHCEALDFGAGMAQETLEEEMLRLIAAAGWAQTILITDIVGGTPFKAAVTLAARRPELRVLTGANLPVLLQLAADTEREGDIDAYIRQAVEEGRFCLNEVDLGGFRA
jgi:PTS system N-acetylgalactosamine-specific IIA component